MANMSYCRFHNTLSDLYDCQNALEIENGDYEDAILVKSAIRSGIDCIVTRNADHFKDIPLQVYSPKQFISIITRLDQGN